MATTTNYSWTTPDDTGLVKDGASAIRTLGTSVDTTVKSLNPGTTAGDLDYYASSTAKTRIPIGTSGQVLSVAAGVPAWSTLSSGGMTVIASGSLASSANIRIQSIPSTYKMLRLFIRNPLGSVTNFTPYLKFNNDTGSNYYHQPSANGVITASTASYLNTDSSNTTGNGFIWIDIPDYADTNHWKMAVVHGSMMNDKTTSTSLQMYRLFIGWNSNVAINEVDITSPNNFTSGTYVLYGVN